MGELGSPTLASLRSYVRDEVDRTEDTDLSPAGFRPDSKSEELLLSAMQLQDLEPCAKLDVEGYELDFALVEQGIKLNIEVDGDQHIDARGRQRRQDVTRDRVLLNLGWTVLRIPAWRCHEEIDLVLDEIKEARVRLLEKIFSKGTRPTGIQKRSGIRVSRRSARSRTIIRISDAMRAQSEALGRNERSAHSMPCHAQSL